MLVLGHRGAIGKNHMQNSLSAFGEALASADGFETDACVTSDGAIFLIHESNQGFAEHLDTASAARVGDRHVNQLTSAEMEVLRLKNGERIPTLWQALELIRNRSAKYLNIELKSSLATEPVLALLEKAPIEAQQLLISSFDHAALKPVRIKRPELKIGALFHEQPREQELTSPLLRELRPEYLVMPEKALTFSTVHLAETYFPKAQLAGWTVTERADFNEADLLARLKSLPSDKIGALIVDHPRDFTAALQAAKLRT